MRKAIDLVIGDTWPKRRRIIHYALGFCALIVLVGMGAAILAGSMSVVEAIVNSAFLLGGTVISSYVFGSVLDDNDKRKHFGNDKDGKGE